MHNKDKNKFLIVSEISVILCTNVWAINCLLRKVSVYQYGVSCQNDCNLYNSCQIIHLLYPTKKYCLIDKSYKNNKERGEAGTGEKCKAY